MEAEYKREQNRNYMIFKQQPVAGGSYAIKMLSSNKVAGLIPFECKHVNGEAEYYYDITSKQPLGRILSGRPITGDEIRKLVSDIIYTVSEAGRYFLPESLILLDAEYIYIDPGNFQSYLCLLPGFDFDFADSFSQLAQYLLDHVSHDDSDAVVVAFGIFKESRKVNFGLEDIADCMAKSSGMTGDDPNNIHKEAGREQFHANNSHREHARERFHANNTLRETGREQIPEFKDLSPSALTEGGSPNNGLPGERHFASGIFGRKHFDTEQPNKGLSGKWCPVNPRPPKEHGGSPYCDEPRHNRKGITGWLREIFPRLAVRPKKKGQIIPRPEDNLPCDDDYWEMEFREDAGFGEEYETAFSWAKPTEDTDADDDGMQTVLLSPGSHETAAHRLISLDGGAEIKLPYFPFIIGKNRSMADFCLDEPEVSRLHLKLEKTGDSFQAVDLNSTNGTRVNGHLLDANETCPVCEGDEVTIAGHRYKFF